nr:hypothetical protein [Tanacetum cinerariifolium]
MPVIPNENMIPKVSVCNKYAIDVEPIPPSQRSNRNVQQGYLNHFKDTLDTLYEIAEEARSNRTFDNSLEYACPRSNTKIDRTLPAKSGHTNNVEAHLRNNKSDLHKKNRVDSGISFKLLVAVAAPRVVDLAGSPSSTTIDQDVPSASTLPTQEIQSQVTHQVPAMAPPTRTDDQMLPHSRCRKVTEQSDLQDFYGHSEAHQLLQSLYCFLDNSIDLHSAVLG